MIKISIFFFLLIVVAIPVNGLFTDSLSIQDYVDHFIDSAKTHFLNESAIGQIWSFFKSNYGRVYSSFEEEKQRLRIFRDHLKYVLESNFERFRTYELEMNEFSDWTSEEFDHLKKGLTISSSLRRRRRRRLRRYVHSTFRRRHERKRFFRDFFYNLFHRKKPSQLPTDQFDWRTKNVISSVKNQMKCGCCYAFSTASILETLYALKRNTTDLIEFSAQQFTDCSSNGNNGCQGGNFPPSIRFIQERGNRIATAQSYPYAAKKQSCQTNNLNEVDVGRIEIGSISEGDEKAMENALVQHGPLFVGVDAESRRFMFYRSGILKINHCPTRRQDMDHAMVVVGYGHDPQLQMSYWIVRNSWGPKWGENGYVRLAKDAGNMCGIASMAYYAKLH